MSGGSFDYFYRRLADGEFQVNAWQLEGLVDSLKQYIEGVYSDGSPRDHDTHDGSWRPFNDDERARFRRDGAVALAAFERLNALLAEAKLVAASLEDVAQSIEWSDSGDTCADDVLRAVSKFAEANR